MSNTDLMTGTCKYCGQVVQLTRVIESDAEAEEEATMKCKCYEAEKYQKEKHRKKKALENVEKLFGSECESVQNLLKAAVEIIFNNEMEKITLSLYGGVKATISQNSKGEINVERTVTKKQKLSE